MVTITAYGHPSAKQITLRRESWDLERTVALLRECGYQCVNVTFVD